MGAPDLSGQPLSMLNHPFHEEIPSDAQPEPLLKCAHLQCVLPRAVVYKGEKSEGLPLESIWGPAASFLGHRPAIPVTMFTYALRWGSSYSSRVSWVEELVLLVPRICSSCAVLIPMFDHAVCEMAAQPMFPQWV